jgi:hypothetical protein
MCWHVNEAPANWQQISIIWRNNLSFQIQRTTHVYTRITDYIGMWSSLTPAYGIKQTGHNFRFNCNDNANYANMGIPFVFIIEYANMRLNLVWL